MKTIFFSLLKNDFNNVYGILTNKTDVVLFHVVFTTLRLFTIAFIRIFF